MSIHTRKEVTEWKVRVVRSTYISAHMRYTHALTHMPEYPVLLVLPYSEYKQSEYSYHLFSSSGILRTKYGAQSAEYSARFCCPLYFHVVQEQL